MQLYRVKGETYYIKKKDVFLEYLKEMCVGRSRHKRRKIGKKKSRVRLSAARKDTVWQASNRTFNKDAYWLVLCNQSTDTGNISKANYFWFSSTQPHTHSYKQTHSWVEQPCRGKRCFNINQVLLGWEDEKVSQFQLTTKQTM